MKFRFVELSVLFFLFVVNVIDLLEVSFVSVISFIVFLFSISLIPALTYTMSFLVPALGVFFLCFLEVPEIG